MPKRPPIFRSAHAIAAAQMYAKDRHLMSSAQQLYDRRWYKVRDTHLQNNALCRYCELEGVVTVATVVDHFWPHRGDIDMFWRSEFWISSCASCHSGMKQSVERAGLDALSKLASRLGIPHAG